MARQFNMTWNRKTRRWFKKHGGKQFVVSCRQLQTAYPTLYQSDTQEGSYQAANQYWAEKSLNTDFQSRKAAVDKQLQALAQIAGLTDAVCEKTRNENSAILQAINGLRGSDDAANVLTALKSILSGGVKPSPAVDTVKGEFLASQYAKVGNGLSAGRYDNMNRHLRHFVSFIGADKPITTVNELTLTTYETHLNTQIQEGKISAAYARSLVQAFKQFLIWSYQNRKIDTLPRNMKSVRVMVPNGKIKTYSVDTVRLLLKTQMTPRTRLFVLLMLNTGMTQQDISDLRQDEVNWAAHTVTRKRSKTANWESVPEVTYPLWDETYRLLVQFRAESGDRVLTTRDGKPLNQSELIAGRLQKCDCIRKAWDEVHFAHKMPLKFFRKTSSSLLASSKDFASVADLFLGHAPRSIAERHYKKAPLELLAEGCLWLAGCYGLSHSSCGEMSC